MTKWEVEENKKTTKNKTSGDFQSSVRSSDTLPYWLPISFQPSPGNTSFVSWLLFPPLLFPPAFSKRRKKHQDIPNFVAHADFNVHCSLGRKRERMCRRDVTGWTGVLLQGAKEGQRYLMQVKQPQQKQQTGGLLLSQTGNPRSCEGSRRRWRDTWLQGRKSSEKFIKKGHVVNIWKGF